MGKFTETKKKTEEQLSSILKKFVDDTGVEINYINFDKPNNVGFIPGDTDYVAKIHIKNN